MKFKVRSRRPDNFHWTLTEGTRRVAKSPVKGYQTMQACTAAIRHVKKHVGDAQMRGAQMASPLKFEVRAAGGKWHWSLVKPDRSPVAVSVRPYPKKADATAVVREVRKEAPKAAIQTAPLFTIQQAQPEWGQQITLIPLPPNISFPLNGVVRLLGADPVRQSKDLSATWAPAAVTATLPARVPFISPTYLIELETVGAGAVQILPVKSVVDQVQEALGNVLDRAELDPQTTNIDARSTPVAVVAAFREFPPGRVEFPDTPIPALKVKASVAWQVGLVDGNNGAGLFRLTQGTQVANVSFAPRPWDGPMPEPAPGRGWDAWRISATITLSAEGVVANKSYSVAVNVLRLPVPRLIAFFNHARFSVETDAWGIPANVLVFVPESMGTDAPETILDSVDQLLGGINAVIGAGFPTLPWLDDLGGAAGDLTRRVADLRKLASKHVPGTGKGPKVMGKRGNWYSEMERTLFWWDIAWPFRYTAEDSMSSILFVGLPGLGGSRANFFNDRFLRPDEGWFQLAIPPQGVLAAIETLHTIAPTAKPEAVLVNPTEIDFADKLSSVEFVYD